MRPSLKEKEGEEEGRRRGGGEEYMEWDDRKKQLHQGNSDIPELRLENLHSDRKSLNSMIYGMWNQSK